MSSLPTPGPADDAAPDGARVSSDPASSEPRSLRIEDWLTGQRYPLAVVHHA